MEINKFSLGETVKIKILNSKGIITSVNSITGIGEGIKYWVEYPISEGKIVGSWFSDFQLDKIEESS